MPLHCDFTSPDYLVLQKVNVWAISIWSMSITGQVPFSDSTNGVIPLKRIEALALTFSAPRFLHMPTESCGTGLDLKR